MKIGKPEEWNPLHEYVIRIYCPNPATRQFYKENIHYEAAVKCQKKIKYNRDVWLTPTNKRWSNIIQIFSFLTSPWLAPFTRPAISTNSIDAGTARWDLLRSESTLRRESGTPTVPTFGSIVQKGKLAAWAFPFSTWKKDNPIYQ